MAHDTDFSLNFVTHSIFAQLLSLFSLLSRWFSALQHYSKIMSIFFEQLFQEYPVFYTDLLKKVRNDFSLDQNQRLILYYEHDAGIFRPLTGADDFDIIV